MHQLSVASVVKGPNAVCGFQPRKSMLYLVEVLGRSAFASRRPHPRDLVTKHTTIAEHRPLPSADSRSANITDAGHSGVEYICIMHLFARRT